MIHSWDSFDEAWSRTRPGPDLLVEVSFARHRIMVSAVDKLEMGVGVDEATDQPGARNSIDMNAASNGGTPTGWATATGDAAVYNMGDNNYNTYEIFVYDEAGERGRRRRAEDVGQLGPQDVEQR